MEYKLPPLPDPKTYWFDTYQGPQSISSFNEGDMRQYAEQAVAPLLAEIERLEDLLFERGEADSLE